ncbi:hypothetical protein GN956_G8878 [Arapaima gigas]
MDLTGLSDTPILDPLFLGGEDKTKEKALEEKACELCARNVAPRLLCRRCFGWSGRKSATRRGVLLEPGDRGHKGTEVRVRRAARVAPQLAGSGAPDEGEFPRGRARAVPEPGAAARPGRNISGAARVFTINGVFAY